MISARNAVRQLRVQLQCCSSQNHITNTCFSECQDSTRCHSTFLSVRRARSVFTCIVPYASKAERIRVPRDGSVRPVPIVTAS